MSDSGIERADPEVAQAILKELERQRNTLEMIPSENFTSLAVLEALGTVLTNKYSEGYPGRRYYGGNEFVDQIETVAIERAKKLFGVPHANVQPYSGSPANFAIYTALCKPGDTIMGLNLTDGGHLTHGWKTSATGMFFNSVPYHVKADGYIDLDEVEELAKRNRPRMIWVGATAYTREFPFKELARIADGADAYLVADVSHIAGLIIAGAHASPVPHAHIVMTTTHKTLRGPRGALLLVTDKGLKKDPELADKIDKAVFPGLQGGPHDNNTAAIAVALQEASTPAFKQYGKQVVKNSQALADSLMKKGLKLVTDGTDNHMILVDLTPLGPGMGMYAQDALELAGIVVNKNTIPKEPASPFYPSGIRLGTPALTTRGMREPEMRKIGELISLSIDEIRPYNMPTEKEARREAIRKFRNGTSENPELKQIRAETMELCRRFPLYPELSRGSVALAAPP